MTLDNIKLLYHDLAGRGFVKKTVDLAKPSTSLTSSPDTAELTDDFIFETLINEPEIYDVSRDLFVGQFYNNAVQEAFTSLDNFIKHESNINDQSGARLMRTVFGGGQPILSINNGDSQSHTDEREGYGHVFAGSMIGIRNPATHEHQWIDNRETALECLIICQHLLRKAKRAVKIRSENSVTN